MIAVHEHTSSIAREWRPCELRLFTPVTLTCSARFRFIASVLPTKHLFGHDRP
jgi:hypothetical protein